MTEITIFHNPKCSKSRATLALIEGRGIAPRIVEYLEIPPTRSELKAILDKLGMKPEQLVRKGEEIFKSEYAGKTLTDAQWIDAMVKHPILIERPIVIRGNRGVLGRPPENAEALLK
jgi:arsenate reductase (glutaredoxin)